MEYNKNKYDKLNDKKVLHKVRKHWVVISLALLSAIGAGGAATTANASTNGQTLDNANHSSQISHALNTQKTGLEKVNSDQNNQNSANHSAGSNNAIQNQAATLHDRILRANYLGNGKQSASANNNGQAANYHSASGNEVQQAITLHNRIIRSTHDYINNNQNRQTETMHMQPRQTQMSAAASEPTLGGAEEEAPMTDVGATEYSASSTDYSAVSSALNSVISSASQVASDFNDLSEYSANASYTNNVSIIDSLDQWLSGYHTEYSDSAGIEAHISWEKSPTGGNDPTFTEDPYVASATSNSDLHPNYTEVSNAVSNYISAGGLSSTVWTKNSALMNDAISEAGISGNDSGVALRALGSAQADLNSLTNKTLGLSAAQTDISEIAGNVSSASKELFSDASSVNSNIYSEQNSLESIFNSVGDYESNPHPDPSNAGTDYVSNYYTTDDIYDNPIPFDGNYNAESNAETFANDYDNHDYSIANVKDNSQLYSALRTQSIHRINIMSDFTVSDDNYDDDYNYDIPQRPLTINGSTTTPGTYHTLTFNDESFHDPANVVIKNLNIKYNNDEHANFDGPFTNQATDPTNGAGSDITFENVNYESGPVLVHTTSHVTLAGKDSINCDRKFSYNNDLSNIDASGISVKPNTVYSDTANHGDVWKVNGNINIGKNANVTLYPGDNGDSNGYYGIRQQNGSFNINQAQVTIDPQLNCSGGQAAGALELSHVNTNISNDGQLDVKYSGGGHSVETARPVNLVDGSTMNITHGGMLFVDEESQNIQLGNGIHQSLVHVDNGSKINVFKQGNMRLVDNKPSSTFTLLGNDGAVNIENPGNSGVRLLFYNDSNAEDQGTLIQNPIDAYSTNIGVNTANSGDPEINNPNNNVYEVLVPPTGDSNGHGKINVKNIKNGELQSSDLDGNTADATALEFLATPSFAFRGNHNGDAGNEVGNPGFWIPDNHHVEGDLLIHHNNIDPVYVRVSDGVNGDQSEDPSVDANSDQAGSSRQSNGNGVSNMYNLKFVPITTDGMPTGNYKEYYGGKLINNLVSTTPTSDNQSDLPFKMNMSHFNYGSGNAVKVTAHSGVNTIEQELYDNNDSGHIYLHTADLNPYNAAGDDFGLSNNLDPINDANIDHDADLNVDLNADPVIWQDENLDDITPDYGQTTIDYVDVNNNDSIVSSTVDYGSGTADFGASAAAANSASVTSGSDLYYVISDASGLPNNYESNGPYDIDVVSANSVSSLAAKNAAADNSANPYGQNASSEESSAYYNDYYYNDVINSASNTVRSESVVNHSLASSSSSNPEYSKAISSASTAISSAASSIASDMANSSDRASVAEKAAKSAHANAASADRIITYIDFGSADKYHNSAETDDNSADNAANSLLGNEYYYNSASTAASGADSALEVVNSEYNDINDLHVQAYNEATSAYDAYIRDGSGASATQDASIANSDASQADADVISASIAFNSVVSYANKAGSISNDAAGASNVNYDVVDYYNYVMSASANGYNVSIDSAVRADANASALVDGDNQTIATAYENVIADNGTAPTAGQETDAYNQFVAASNAARNADNIEANVNKPAAISFGNQASHYATLATNSARVASMSAASLANTPGSYAASVNASNASSAASVARSAATSASDAAIRVNADDLHTLGATDSSSGSSFTSNAESYAQAASEDAAEASYQDKQALSAMNLTATYNNSTWETSASFTVSSAVANGSNAASDFNVNQKNNAVTSDDISNENKIISNASSAVSYDISHPSTPSAQDASQQADSASVAASAADKIQASLDSNVASSEARDASYSAAVASASAAAASNSAKNLPGATDLPPNMIGSYDRSASAIINSASDASQQASSASNDASLASSYASDAGSYNSGTQHALSGSAASISAALASQAAMSASSESTLASKATINASNDASFVKSRTASLDSQDNNIDPEIDTIASAISNINHASMASNVRLNSAASSAVSSASELARSASASASSDSVFINERPNISDTASLINAAYRQATSAASAAINADLQEISADNAVAGSTAKDANVEATSADASANTAVNDANVLSSGPDSTDSNSAHSYASLASTYAKNASRIFNTANDDYINANAYSARANNDAMNRHGDKTSVDAELANNAASGASNITNQVSEAYNDASEMASYAISAASLAASNDGAQMMIDVGQTVSRGLSAANDVNVHSGTTSSNAIQQDNNSINADSRAVVNDHRHARAIDGVINATKASNALKDAEAYETGADQSAAIADSTEANQDSSSASKFAKLANTQVGNLADTPADHSNRANAISYANAATNEAHSAADDSNTAARELTSANADRFVANQTNGFLAFNNAKNAASAASVANSAANAAKNASASAAHDSIEVNDFVNAAVVDNQVATYDQTQVNNASNHASVASNSLKAISGYANQTSTYSNNASAKSSSVSSDAKSVSGYNNDSANNSMKSIAKSASSYSQTASIANADALNASTAAKQAYINALNMVSAIKSAAKSNTSSAVSDEEQTASLDQSTASVAAKSASQDVSNASTAADQAASQSSSAGSLLNSVANSLANVHAREAREEATAAAQDVVYDALTGNADSQVVDSDLSSLSNSRNQAYNSTSANHALHIASSANVKVNGIENTINVLSSMGQNYNNASANSALASVVSGINSVSNAVAADSSAANSANQVASGDAQAAGRYASLATAEVGHDNNAVVSYASLTGNANASASLAFSSTMKDISDANAQVANAESYSNAANNVMNGLFNQAKTAGQDAKNASSNDDALNNIADNISPVSQSADSAFNAAHDAASRANDLRSQGAIYNNGSANANLNRDANSANSADQDAENTSAGIASAEVLIKDASSDAANQVSAANSAAADTNPDHASSAGSVARNAVNQIMNDINAVNEQSGAVKSLATQASQNAVSAQSAVDDASNAMTSLASSAAAKAGKVASDAATDAAQVQSNNPNLTSASNEIAKNSAAVQSASATISSYNNGSANAQLASIVSSVNAANFNAANVITAINNEKSSAKTEASVASQQASFASLAMSGVNAGNLNSANSASASITNDSMAIDSNVAKVASIAAQTNNYVNNATNLITGLNSNASATASDYARNASSRAASLASAGSSANSVSASASRNAASVSQANSAIRSASNSINSYHNNSADQIMNSLSAAANSANQAAASQQASIASAAQQINNSINAANSAAAKAASFAKSGNANSASAADSSAASIANDAASLSARIKANVESLSAAAAKMNSIENFDQSSMRNLNASIASGASQDASQAMVAVDNMQLSSNNALQLSSEVSNANQNIIHNSLSANNYHDEAINTVMSNDSNYGLIDNNSAGSYSVAIANDLRSASEDLMLADSAANAANSAAIDKNGSLAINESNSASNYANEVNSLSAVASSVMNNMELASMSATSTANETASLLSNLSIMSAKSAAQSCVISINYVDAQNNVIGHVDTIGRKGAGFDLAHYVSDVPAGYRSAQILYGGDISSYEPGNQNVMIKIVPNTPSSSNGNDHPSSSNGSNSQSSNPNWDANNGNPSVAPSSNASGRSGYSSNQSSQSANHGKSSNSSNGNKPNGKPMVVHHNGNNHHDSDTPSDVPSDGGYSDSGNQEPENGNSDDQGSAEPSSNEPTEPDNGNDNPSNNQEFRNGVNDARQGLSMRSNDAAYVEGYDDFNKAKLPQTGESHQHVGMATAMMMALAIVSMGLGKTVDRRRHDE